MALEALRVAPVKPEVVVTSPVLHEWLTTVSDIVAPDRSTFVPPVRSGRGMGRRADDPTRVSVPELLSPHEKSRSTAPRHAAAAEEGHPGYRRETSRQSAFALGHLTAVFGG